jgi:glucose dehydrogenase
MAGRANGALGARRPIFLACVLLLTALAYGYGGFRLLVNDTLYFCTQTNIVIALDPETGAERWRYDPKIDATGASLVATCRGVAYAHVAAATDCPKRIITSTFDTRLLAIDADTGELCASFGEQ